MGDEVIGFVFVETCTSCGAEATTHLHREPICDACTRSYADAVLWAFKRAMQRIDGSIERMRG